MKAVIIIIIKCTKAAHQSVIRPKAAKWLIIVYRDAWFWYLLHFRYLAN